VRAVHDGQQKAQGYDWALPDIFAPFRAEYENGIEFGSLWDQWLKEMRGALAQLADDCEEIQPEDGLSSELKRQNL
jgi:hypothetical protein